MGIISKYKEQLESENKKPFPYNTGTLFDFITGKFEFNPKDKKYYLNGGLFYTLAVAGKQNTFKSTFSMSLLARTLAIYPETEAIIYDTERALNDLSRLVNLIGDLKLSEKQKQSILDRVILIDRDKYDLDKFYKFLLEFKEEKKKHLKDYIIETPFINPKTNQPYLTVIPTFVMIDSWTMMQSSSEKEVLEKFDPNKLQSIFMLDGHRKTVFFRALPNFYTEYGIYFILTAHIGKQTQMSPFEPVTKYLEYMQYGDKIKGTGSQFGFLTTNLIETRKSPPLLDDKKQCYYPHPENPVPNELHELLAVLCRSKTQSSGISIPFIVSQYYGIQHYLSCFYIAKEFKLGIEGERSFRCSLYPSISFNRKTIRKAIDIDNKLCRALEFLAYYILLKNNILNPYVPLANQLVKEMEISDLAKIFEQHPEYLETVNYWNFDKKHNEKYMSIIDVILKHGKKII